MAIARAMLRDPDIMVLDEVTSALDPVTEAAIHATLERVAKGRTVVTVTHRLASVRHADRIFVLDCGRLVECGRHDDLLAQGGLYAQLWQKQSGFLVSADGTTATVDAVWLRAIPMFAALDVTLLEAIAEHFVTERLPAGYTICQEGDPGDKFYVVVHGAVRVTITGPSGAEQELSILRDGDHFGEIALLQDVPRTATVRTRTPTLLLVLKREQFLKLVATAPQVRQKVDAAIGHRLDVGYARGIAVRRTSVRQLATALSQ